MTEQLTLFDVITETASCWGGGVKRFSCNTRLSGIEDRRWFEAAVHYLGGDPAIVPKAKGLKRLQV